MNEYLKENGGVGYVQDLLTILTICIGTLFLLLTKLAFD